MGILDVRRACAITVSTLAAASPGAQAPYAAWRTLTTAHYRLHYPPVLADWAQDVGSRIEGIHRQVVALVGYESPRPVQVLLVDPMGEPNGMAMPLLPNPYVILWRTEPRSDDTHGSTLSSWTEELVSHEMTHIHHLTRPKRPPTVLNSLFGLPIGPLVLKCPRWVSEGYATLAEGRITGSARPHSAMRAALIRQWARLGKLPPYGALDGFQGFQGGSMAYLVGSAYLEWLERQPGPPEPLKRLWRQLASRRNRSFNAAFLATFGFSAEDGYQRFQAETAHDALAWELRLKAQGLREGKLFVRTDGALRDLAVSPDGTRLLASLEDRGAPGLRIWDLKEAQPVRKVPKPDPFNAVEDVPPESPVRAPAASLPTLDHRLPHLAQWVDDHTIRFQLKRADAEGVLHREPALWRLPGGVETRPAAVPPPRWKTLDPVHRDGLWRLEWEGLPVALPGQAVGRAFVDEARSVLWAACEVEGIWNLVKVPYTREGGVLRCQKAQVMTRTVSGAWNPAPSPDGRTLYFTTLDPRGMEIRSLDLDLAPLPAAPVPETPFLTTAAVLPPPVEKVSLPRATGPLPTAPYRALDHQWLQVSSGAILAPSGESWQLGVAGADLLGRFSWQVLGGFGDGAGPRGAMAGFSSTAWAWKPSMMVFSALERPSSQRFAPVPADRQRRGAEAAATWDDQGETRIWFSPVVAAERVEDLDAGATRTRSLLGLRAGLGALWARGPWGLALTPGLQWFPGVTSGEGTNRWTLLRAELAARLENPILPLTLRAAGGSLANTAGAASPETFRLGGLTSSLVPESLDCDRVEQPALPDQLATGDHFLRWRGEAGGPLSLYLEGTRVWNAGEARPPFLRVAGLQYTLVNPLGLGSEAITRRMRLQVGLHRPLDGIMKDRTVATLALVLRP